MHGKEIPGLIGESFQAEVLADTVIGMHDIVAHLEVTEGGDRDPGVEAAPAPAHIMPPKDFPLAQDREGIGGRGETRLNAADPNPEIEGIRFGAITVLIEEFEHALSFTPCYCSIRLLCTCSGPIAGAAPRSPLRGVPSGSSSGFVP